MTHIVVDPVTRIEGHLRIEAEINEGKVSDAWSSSTMFRGIEIILQGRDPRDAWAFTQRICGVCTTVHAIASIRAVEDAIGAKPPPNARILRNLIIASQCIQDHVIHFYHLHALDWVDIVSALEADPKETAALAQSISDWGKSSATYFKGIQDRVKGLVERGQLGPFANAYWGHSAYKLPPAANLMAVAHYLEALEWQREFIKMHAILGGKNPHLQSFLVGGMATPVDPDKQASLNIHTIAQFKKLIAGAQEFVSKVYIPDLLAVASFYKDWAGYGAGVGNYMVYGEYPLDDEADPELYIKLRYHSRTRHLEGRRVRSLEDHRADHPLLVRLRRRRRASASSFRGRNQPELHRAGAALRTLGHCEEVLLVEVAPLRGRTDGGRTAITDAGLVRSRSREGEGLGRPRARSTRGWASSAVLDARTGRGARHRNPGAGRQDRRLGRRARRQHGQGRASHPRQQQVGAGELAGRTAMGAGFHEAPRGSLGHWVHVKRRQDRPVSMRGAEHLERRSAGFGRRPPARTRQPSSGPLWLTRNNRSRS